MDQTVRLCECGRPLPPSIDNVVPLRCPKCHFAVRLLRGLKEIG